MIEQDRTGKQGKGVAEVFRVVAEEKEVEIVIQKSRFIAATRPVEDEKEAQHFIRERKKIHWDATHNTSAYVVSAEKTTVPLDVPQIHKADDDGEPQGTAGRPILEVIKAKDLVQTVIVVTRYFGGIKLGAGGLVRAYSAAAARVIEASGIRIYVPVVNVRVTVPYALYESLTYQLEHAGIHIMDRAFAEEVTLMLAVPKEKEVAFWQMLQSFFAGDVRAHRLHETYEAVNILYEKEGESSAFEF